MRCLVLLALSVLLLPSCATYRDDFARGQKYYEVSQFDNALAMWRLLEHDWDSLDAPEQARYAYFRGMTDYRLGFRADARHWLALSKVMADKPGVLDAQASAQLEQVLTELNTAQYKLGLPTSAVAAGVELTNVTPPPAPSASSVPAAAEVESTTTVTTTDKASIKAP